MTVRSWHLVMDSVEVFWPPARARQSSRSDVLVRNIAHSMLYFWRNFPSRVIPQNISESISDIDTDVTITCNACMMRIGSLR